MLSIFTRNNSTLSTLYNFQCPFKIPSFLMFLLSIRKLFLGRKKVRAKRGERDFFLCELQTKIKMKFSLKSSIKISSRIFLKFLSFFCQNAKLFCLNVGFIHLNHNERFELYFRMKKRVCNKKIAVFHYEIKLQNKRKIQRS